MRCLALMISTALLASSALAAEFRDVEGRTRWLPLLDKDLSRWRIYQGYPNADTPVAGLARNEDGEYAEPVGYDRNARDVFTVSVEPSGPLLRVSGEIYGGIFTKSAFSNYHLRLQVKWGTQKWPPREDLPLDTGILYHANGEHGVDYWRAWPLSQEFQIIEAGVEGTTGDWWKIADAQIDIRCQRDKPEAPYVFSPSAPKLTFGGEAGADITCRASHDNEKPHGEWNTLDLITYNGQSLHIVNGEVVMALSGSAHLADDGVHPLREGHIVLQSEAGEAFFRNIEIRPVKQIPAKYQHYFPDESGH